MGHGVEFDFAIVEPPGFAAFLESEGGGVAEMFEELLRGVGIAGGEFDFFAGFQFTFL